MEELHFVNLGHLLRLDIEGNQSFIFLDIISVKKINL